MKKLGDLIALIYLLVKLQVKHVATDYFITPFMLCLLNRCVTKTMADSQISNVLFLQFW